MTKRPGKKHSEKVGAGTEEEIQMAQNNMQMLGLTGNREM